VSINHQRRAEAVFNKAKELGLINPATGDGMPTVEMVKAAIFEADADASPETDELAMYVRRLARIVKKTDPENKIVASAVEFLTCVGKINPMR